MARFPDLFIEVLDPLDFELEERAPRPLDTPDSRPPTWLIDHPLLDLDPADLVPVTFSKGRGREGRGVTLPELSSQALTRRPSAGRTSRLLLPPLALLGRPLGHLHRCQCPLEAHLACRGPSNGARAQEVAPFVLRQILSHERAHFAVEVGVTYMEDASDGSCTVRTWRGASTSRISSTRCPLKRRSPPGGRCAAGASLPASGDPRLASCRQAGTRRRQPGQATATRAIWKANETECRRERAAAVAGDVRGAGSWFEVARDEEEQVPVYWVGDSSFSPRSAAFGRRPVSSLVRRLRSWLQRRVG